MVPERGRFQEGAPDNMNSWDLAVVAVVVAAELQNTLEANGQP